MAEAWRALDRAPADREVKAQLVRLLHRHPELVAPERRDALSGLLADARVEPLAVARAAWQLQLADGQPLGALAGDPAELASWAESDDLTYRLLTECPVAVLAAERALTRLRRWLLLSGGWPRFPRLVEALVAQAAWNGGAWLIEADETERLEAERAAPIAAAYFAPALGPAGTGAFANPVTDAVAAQYEQWPYPTWSRLTARAARTLPEAVAELDRGRPSDLPVEAELLVAGCGTGREAALWAQTLPDARITAIDLSEASLSYARERCHALGIERIDFRRLDLYRVAELGMTFDVISCGGVLHHLPDPEGGWAALAAVLRPGGAMRVLVYSKVARLRIRAAQSLLADLRDRPVDADLLREARRRLIEHAPQLLEASTDFYSLAGIHDLLLHRHEDPFDVPRIAAALDRLGLELLAFRLPTPWHRARYLEEHPDDPAFRDLDAWASLEKHEPFLFRGCTISGAASRNKHPEGKYRDDHLIAFVARREGHLSRRRAPRPRTPTFAAEVVAPTRASNRIGAPRR